MTGIDPLDRLATREDVERMLLVCVAGAAVIIVAFAGGLVVGVHRGETVCVQQHQAPAGWTAA